MDHPDRGSSGGRRAAPTTGLGRPAGISQLAGRGVRGALFGVYPDHTLLYRLRAAGGLLGMGHPPLLPPQALAPTLRNVPAVDSPKGTVSALRSME